MIKKLQKRFIRISVAALSVAMLMVVAVVNIANRVSVYDELYTTMGFISEGEPNIPPDGDIFPPSDSKGSFHSGRMNPHFSQNASRREKSMVAESNWYGVYYDENGDVLSVSSINTIDEDQTSALEIAAKALSSGKNEGFIGDYMYRIVVSSDGCRTVFLLNCEVKLGSMRRLMLISAAAYASAIVITFVIVSVASRRAVAPTIKNMEQQKQFITNASHELKTPLTVISTNMELLDMDVPGNQWVSATKKQTSVMRKLVDELVYLSRMEEEGSPLDPEDANLKKLICEVAEPFEAMAEYSGREFNVDIEDGLHAVCDIPSIKRLMSTLCDNAMKYAEGEGSVDIIGKTDGKYAVVEVSNEVSKPLTKDECSRLFDRFYRADPSRSKEKQSGFGIGLAIAQAIAQKHSGSLEAEMYQENRLKLTLKLPIKGN